MPKSSAAPLKQVGGKFVSARSKTGNPECSQAMSVWVRGRKLGGVPAAIFAILARCRAQARQNKGAASQQNSGKLAPGRGTWQRSEQAQALAKARAAAPARTRAAAVAPAPATAPKLAPGRGTPERVTHARAIQKVRAMPDGATRSVILRDMKARLSRDKAKSRPAPQPTSAPVFHEVETIGQNKGWIAEIKGKSSKYGYEREFQGTKDYSRANKPRTRGVYTGAHLHEGKIYEINAPSAWGKVHRYYATVKNGEVVPVDAAHVNRHMESAAGPTTPNPAPPKLAPGRGTEIRSQQAQAVRMARKIPDAGTRSEVTGAMKARLDAARGKAPKAAAAAAAPVPPPTARAVAPGRGTPDRSALAAGLKAARKVGHRDDRFDAIEALGKARSQARKGADAARSPVVTPAHIAAVHAAHARLDAANGGTNFVKVHQIRRALPHISRPELDATFRHLQATRAYSGASHEGHRGKTTRSERRAALVDGRDQLVYLERADNHPGKTALGKARAAAPAPSKPPERFGLRPESAVRSKPPTNEGAGKTKPMFEEMRGAAAKDLPGQTTFHDKHEPTTAQLARGLPKISGGSPMAVLERARAHFDHRSKLGGKVKALRSEVRKLKVDPATHTDHKPGTVTNLNTDLLHADPARFQYKLAASHDTGSVGSLAGVKKYDPELGGVLQVWKDPADGKTYVVNGHNRLDLARKLGAGQVTTRFIHARDATEARSKGALTNIAEGRGDSLDAAKYFRDTGIDRPALEARGIPLKEKVATEGLGLAGLHPKVFDRVTQGEITPARGAIIGGSGLSHDQQAAMVSLIDKHPRGGHLTDGAVRELAHEVKSAGSAKSETRDLFGSSVDDQSLALHKVALQDRIKRRLSGEKKLFGTVSKSKHAAALEEAGNRINADESGRISKEAGQTLAVFDQMKSRSGPVATALNHAAERIHAGENARDVEDETYKHIVKSIPEYLGGTGQFAG